MERDDAIRRIKKCMALAKSQNAHEAATALRQAHKLMEEWNIEQGFIDCLDVTEERMDSGCRRYPPLWKCRLARAVATAFDCEVIVQANFLSTDFTFIGASMSPKLATYAYEVLDRQLARARSAHVAGLKRCKLSTKRRRGDAFANAWISAVGEKVSAFAGADEVTEKAVRAYMDCYHPDLQDGDARAKKYQAWDESSLAAGYLSGRKAELNHGVTGGDRPARLTH